MSFKARAKSFIEDVCPRFGFVPAKSQAHRDGDDLRQGFYLQPGTGRRAGSFRVQCYWTFMTEPLSEPSAMAATFGTSRFCRETGLSEPDYPAEWLPCRTKAEVEVSFGTLMTLVESRMLPFLDAHRTVGAIVDAVERGELGVRDAFGDSTLRNLARCYEHVGQAEKGARRFAAYLAQCDESPDEDLRLWAAKMRESARSVFGGVATG